jgi:hypothetical protein
MTTPIFSYTPDQLASTMTATVHDTLHYLASNEYLTYEQIEELKSILAVAAISNRKGLGQRILDRMFNGDKTDGTSWIFPIVEIDTRYNNTVEEPTDPPTKTSKPNLTVVQ